MAEKVYDLDINSEAFNAFKLDFNAILKALLHAMSKNGAENGEIAVSLKVNIEEKDVIDRGYQRAANVPSFDHKITSKMQFKNEKKGSLSGNFELVYDEEKNEWCIKEIRDDQISFFDDGSEAQECVDAGEIIDVECSESDDDKSLEGPDRLMLGVSEDPDDFDTSDISEDDLPY
ncbi:MAG: hypothetical protein IKP95_09265 [Ruminococcus sp.]|nr:hypothetical protein [Ruminococcus sp.]